MDQLQFKEVQSNGNVILEMKGSLNSYTYSDFQDKVYSMIEKNNVILDMNCIENLSSAGLGVLMSAMEMGEEWRHNLYILNPSSIVRMAIESTGYEDMFNFISSQSEL